MGYNIIAILLSIIIPAIVIREPIIKLIKKEKISIKNYKFEFTIYVLIAIGCLVRTVGINMYPQGLNPDEASSTYEAFSILEYGVDRNGHSFPVFLEAWGSGQNALYTYIMIPFIKILGVNLISTRLPMVLISIISLFIWYNILIKMKNKKFAVIGLAFFVICPWHIMKSRWGLESNIFPDITLYAVWFIIKFLETKKARYFYIGMLFLGITAYSYGTSYFFLPMFLIPLLIYLRYKKEINTSKIFIGLAIVAIISLPIILYVLINTFDFNEISVGPFTIPRLQVNRYEEQTGLFSGNIVVNLFKNFISQIDILVTQNDGLIWNNIPGFGMTYVVSLPFLIIGIIYGFNIRNKYISIFKIWFVSSFLLFFVLNDVNINRINIFIFPMIYFTLEGIYCVVENNKKTLILIAVIYVFSFIGFEVKYVFTKSNKYVFVDNIQEVIEYVNDLDAKNIYFEYSFKEPYIYVLYYTQYNAHEFKNTVVYFNEDNIGSFDNVKGFGKYKFYIPEEIENTKDNVYVIHKNNNENLDYSKFEVKEFKDYIVLYSS